MILCPVRHENSFLTSGRNFNKMLPGCNMGCQGNDNKGPFTKISWLLLVVSLVMSIVALATDFWLVIGGGAAYRGLWKVCYVQNITISSGYICFTINDIAESTVWARNDRGSQAVGVLSVLCLTLACFTNSIYLFLKKQGEPMVFIGVCAGFGSAGFLLINILVFGVFGSTSDTVLGWSYALATASFLLILFGVVLLFVEYTLLLNERCRKKNETLSDENASSHNLQPITNEINIIHTRNPEQVYEMFQTTNRDQETTLRKEVMGETVSDSNPYAHRIERVKHGRRYGSRNEDEHNQNVLARNGEEVKENVYQDINPYAGKQERGRYNRRYSGRDEGEDNQTEPTRNGEGIRENVNPDTNPYAGKQEKSRYNRRYSGRDEDEDNRTEQTRNGEDIRENVNPDNNPYAGKQERGRYNRRYSGRDGGEDNQTEPTRNVEDNDLDNNRYAHRQERVRGHRKYKRRNADEDNKTSPTRSADDNWESVNLDNNQEEARYDRRHRNRKQNIEMRRTLTENRDENTEDQDMTEKGYLQIMHANRIRSKLNSAAPPVEN